jgi:thiamine pyrophosphate-dependent acetolactate synthase large subunit-like protein
VKKSTKTSKNHSVGRRRFLKGAAAGAAGAAMLAGKTAGATAEPLATRRPAALPPTEAELARETQAVQRTPAVESYIVERPASDQMVDVLRALDLEYCASNPGSSFEGLQESIVNYGDNRMPEFLTCLHEESAVAMAHGYAKIEGKPMMALLHGTVGLQHGAMAIYNAYADRVPVYIVVGLDNDGPVAAHNALDMAAMVRDFVKWDHQPESLDQFGQSAVRAYTLATTPPMAPVLLVLDARLQKAPLEGAPAVPTLSAPRFPAADSGSVKEIARLLVAANNPRINAGQVARTQEGIDLLVELAELLQAPVNGVTNRLNFPSRHPLAGAGTGQGDLVLNLEPTGRGAAPGMADGTTITISASELLVTSNYNVRGAARGGDIIVAADAQATLPALIEEVRRQVTDDRKRHFEERGQRYASTHARRRQREVADARHGWDATPVSLARVAAELWPLIKDHEDDWSFVSPQRFLGSWPGKLWDMTRPHHFIGNHGAGGMGYGAPAAVGAALANRKYGRISINIQGDGDLNYAPGVLWTAAHHQIPLLTIVANNRAYHQELMFMQQQCAARNRGVDRARIGTTIEDPNIDYTQMAKAYGLYAEGPIANPNDLGPALRRAVDRVKAGEPALLDVVTQPRG